MHIVAAARLQLVNISYMMLGLIKRNFRHLTVPVFILLYKTMVRSHLDYWYCCSVWAPYRKGDIEALEKGTEKSKKEFASIEAPSV